MTKYNKGLPGETEKLDKKNTMLRQQLKEAKKSIDAIKTGNIDGLVLLHENELKLYTEKTADKPYRILIEKMHEGAVTLNKDGLILYCNSYFANMVNLPLQKVIGTKFENFLAESSKEQLETLLGQGIEKAKKEEVYIYTGDGNEIPVLMTVNAMLLDNIFVLSIILTDLTVLKENQQRLKRRTKQLEQKNKELESANRELAFQIEEKEKRAAELIIADKELEFQTREKEKRASELIIADKELEFQTGEKQKRAAELVIINKEMKHLLHLNADQDLFMSILAHDLRSPFNGLLGLSELLTENIRQSDADTIENLANHINKSARNAFNLLEDLLMWTQSQSGKLPYEPQKLWFTDICLNILETMSSNAEAKNITINFRKAEDITVFADVDMLKTVLRNLVSNAIKFTNPGGRINIYAKQNQKNVTIMVADNGTGIAPETIKMLFDSKQLHTSIGTANEIGTGLGLFLCKKFVKKHGGKIWAESVEGAGSSFNFTLPRSFLLNKLETADKI
jgi:PAS domain S-box-containing protein